MSTLKEHPKVSVCVITYNQEKYIRQCLQSLVDQVTNFDYEIIVGEDCSTDTTRQIVEDFANKYPHLIHPIYQVKNIGAGTNNFITVHNAATGRYIAYLDGDDYSFPDRLQKQADVLDAEPNCNIVYHRMMVEIKGLKKLIEGPFCSDLLINTKKFYRAELLQHNSIGWQSSKMYRASIKLKQQKDFEILDVFTTIEQVGTGYAKFSSYDALGVYRLQIGMTNNRTRLAYALSGTYKYFFVKYPEHRLEINTAMLVYFVTDLKHLRRTAFVYGKAWLNTWHPLSIFRFFSCMPMIKKLIVKHSSS